MGFDPEVIDDAFEPVLLSREFEFDKADDAELRAAPGDAVEEPGLLEFDLLIDSGTELERALLLLFDAVAPEVRAPGRVNTTSSRFERCSTCAVAPG